MIDLKVLDFEFGFAPFFFLLNMIQNAFGATPGDICLFLF